MKRTRDDVYAASDSQFKRTFCTSRGDSYGQSQVPGGGGGGGGGGDGAGNCGGGGGSTLQKLTTTDALSYLKEVKDMFQNQREKYDMFLEVMKDFKAQRTDTAGVIARVKELFKGHNNLIFGFNTFLPKGYEIKLDEDEAPPKKTVEFEEAISFVNKIKKRFQNDEHVYKSFLDILNMYRKESKDINEVYKEVAALFEDHPDLLEEFTRFLPNNSVTPAQYVVPNGRNSSQRFNERSSTVASMRQMQLDKQRRRDKLITAHDRDLSVDHPELDDDKAMIKVPKEQRKRVEKENRDRRIHNQDEREPDLDNIRDLNLQRFPDKKIYVKKAEGFGLTADFPSHDDKDTLKGMYNQAFSFCEKVKERLGSSDDYQAFLKCLHIFSNGIIKRHDLHDLVISLLGKYPDLMDKFNDFLDRCENIDGFLAGVISKKSLCGDGQLSKSSKLEDKDKDQKREMDGTKERERYQEKYMGKSIQELDLSNCEHCTPSYRHLPDDYPIPMASQRSELGAQVLNDYWVSVTSGSEDYSFKHMRRNQYEESLFRCEDDRFELDMLLESVSSAAKRTEELYNSIIENKINLEGPIRLEEYFSVLNLRCIERLYGDHGLDAIETLRKNPTVALPVILTRLKQKQEEWSRCHLDFNKVWAEIYAKNHYRSLDHRSFYFKQQDSKNLNPKSLVTEIKEIKEKQQKQDDVLQAIAAGNKQPLIPHLEFEYSDVGIHEDLYKLVQYSCEEVFASKELLNKILRLWTTFLEPMLGVPSRSHEAVDVAPVGDSLLMNSRQPKSDNYEADGRITEVKIVHQTCLAANDKENGSIDTDHVCRDDSLMDKGQKNVDSSDKISGFSKQFISDEERADNNASSIAVRGENSVSRTSFEMISGCVHSSSRPTGTVSDDDSVGKSQSGDASLVERRDIATLVPLANGMIIGSSNQEGFAGPCKIEKEEGELSPTPNVDSQEDNCVGYGDANVQAKPQSKLDLERSKFRSRNGEGERSLEAGLHNGADADDEDIENASEAGVDVSQSESAGDECSQEEHEGEEDIEHDDIDGKAESEGEAGGMCNGRSAGGDGSLLPLSERSLLPVKPLTKHVSADSLVEERKDSRVFYGNDDFYVLFRLHQILYERILSAKTNSTSAEAKWRIAKDANSLDPYSRFMNALYNLLDGSAENAKFEDECRAIIGNQSYMLFTLDKLIYKLVRQLQAVATDEIDNKLLQLFEYEKSRKPGRLTNSVHHANARVILHEENIYHFNCFSNPSKLSIQLMDNMTEKPEVFAVSIDPNFAVYLYNDYLSVFPDKKEPHGFILQRNKRKHSDLDDLSAMEGVKVINGLECKIACNSSKISYVLDTEDLFFRPRKNRKTSLGTASSKHYRGAKVERFHRILSGSK